MLYDYNRDHRPDPSLRVQTAVVSYFEVLCVVGVNECLPGRGRRALTSKGFAPAVGSGLDTGQN